MRSHEDAAGRRLHDTSPGAPVVTATTARQLQAAIVSGAEHIEIRQHLDLTTLSILESDGESPVNQDDAILGAVPSSVKSIRVRPLSAEPLAICASPLISTKPVTSTLTNTPTTHPTVT